jgi:hypothetical protein
LFDQTTPFSRTFDYITNTKVLKLTTTKTLLEIYGTTVIGGAGKFLLTHEK